MSFARIANGLECSFKGTVRPDFGYCGQNSANRNCLLGDELGPQLSYRAEKCEIFVLYGFWGFTVNETNSNNNAPRLKQRDIDPCPTLEDILGGLREENSLPKDVFYLVLSFSRP